jgi:glycosyltransferase involved in cell wall biosynthesis
MARFTLEWPRLVSVIAQMLSSCSIDLIYVNAPRLLPAAAVAARLRSRPLVFHCHNRLIDRPGLIVAGEALRLSRAHVIACCNYTARPIKPYVQPGRVSILYNGVERFTSRSSGPRPRLRRIGVIGRIEPEKGQAEFVSATRRILSRFSDCRFFIVGAPMFSDSEYFNKIVKASADLPITFLGWRDDIPNVLSGLDLLVVPSSHLDATPRVIFEAFSSCVPVVAFPSGGIPEIITDEETGFLTSTADSQALADRICSILQMSSCHVRAVVRRAWKHWQQDYTIELYRERVAEFLLHAATTCP